MSMTEPPMDDPPHTPALPGEPSPITDGELPEIVTQLRGILAEVAKAAVDEAIAAMPQMRVIAGTVQQVDVTLMQVVVQTDDASEGASITAQVISERPNPNERVMVLSVPGGAAFVFGHVGGDGVPPGSLIGSFKPITAAVSSSSATAPPRGYAMAYGQVLKQAAVPWYTAEVGSQYNTGGEAADEVRMPDMRGRYPVGLDNMGGSDAGRLSSIANVVGSTGGAETHTLSTGNLPSHTHSLSSHTHSFTPSGSVTGISGSVSSTLAASTTAHALTGSGGVPVWDGTNGPDFFYAPSAWVGGSVSGSASGSFSEVSGTFNGSSGSTLGPSTSDTGAAGSGSAVTHLPPTMAVFWLVKL